MRDHYSLGKVAMPLPKLSSSNLELVSNNLQNIYIAAHDDKKQTIELVPAIFGNKLYYPTVGWRGRILRLIHACIALFTDGSFTKNKLKKAIATTKECFAKLEDFRHQYHDVVYQNYLDSRFQNIKCKYSEKEIENSRRQIKEFYQATYPFSQLVQSKTNAKLNIFLETHYKGTSPFYCESTFKSVKDFVRILSIEGFAQGELPLSIFRKIGKENVDQQPKNVAKADEKVLISFVKKMNKAKKEGKFQVEIFHSAMKSLTRHLKQHQNENAYNLIDLEKALIREGCILLDEFDKKHVGWRQKLRKGDKFVESESDEPFYFLNERHQKILFALGECKKGPEKSEDRYKVYEIHDPNTNKKHDDLLMVIGPNKVCLEYSDIMRLESYWGLETPKKIYIHPQGRYAIVEMLPYSLDGIDWESDRLGNLDEEDMPFVEPLRMLIQFFMDEKNSPKDLRTEYLRLDSIGRLKSIKDCIPSGHIDYISLEEMAFQLAHRNNLPIYQYLIEPLREEKFSKDKIMPFFREAVSSAFEKETISMESLAKKSKITDEAIIERSKVLQKYASELRDDCTEIICYIYHPVDREKLRIHMSKCLLTLFDNDKTFGRFWSSLKAEDLAEEVERDIAAFV